MENLIQVQEGNIKFNIDNILSMYWSIKRQSSSVHSSKQHAWLILTSLIPRCLSKSNMPQNFKRLILGCYRIWEYLRQLVLKIHFSLKCFFLNIRQVSFIFWVGHASKQEFYILIVLNLLEANRILNKSWRAATEQHSYSKPLLTM